MGGLFFTEKVNDHLKLELVFPTFQFADGFAYEE